MPQSKACCLAFHKLDWVDCLPVPSIKTRSHTPCNANSQILSPSQQSAQAWDLPSLTFTRSPQTYRKGGPLLFVWDADSRGSLCWSVTSLPRQRVCRTSQQLQHELPTHSSSTMYVSRFVVWLRCEMVVRWKMTHQHSMVCLSSCVEKKTSYIPKTTTCGFTWILFLLSLKRWNPNEKKKS